MLITGFIKIQLPIVVAPVRMQDIEEDPKKGMYNQSAVKCLQVRSKNRQERLHLKPGHSF